MNDAPTMQQTVTPDTICAGFGERLVAALIDGVILLIPNVIFYQLVGGLPGNLIAIIIDAAYAIYFWTESGSTPGKSVMGLRVVKADGGDLLDVSGAITRYVGQIISAVALLLGYLWVIWDPKHEAWHDKIAKTKVIKYK